MPDGGETVQAPNDYKMKIAFLIHRSALGGGTYVVYQHALHLIESGHDVTIVTLVRESPLDDVWHPGIPKLKFVHVDDAVALRFDLALGTLWSTMLDLHRIPSNRYAYFVQSIESRFYPETATRRRGLIDTIYGWRLPGVTEATWIRDHLEARYGTRYHLVRNGVRKDLYRAEGPSLAPRNAARPRILVEGAFSAIKNTSRALATARRAGGAEVWLLTMSDIPWYPGVRRVFRNVPVDQVAPIYRSCDLILKLSLVEGMFGPPLEMFHCGGTAVVYDVTGHDEYIVHGRNALVVPMNDENGVVDALRRVTGQPALLDTLKRGALETAAAWPSWDASSTEFALALSTLMESEAFTRERLLDARGCLERDFPDEIGQLRPAHPRPAKARPLRSTVRRYRTFLGHVMDSYR